MRTLKKTKTYFSRALIALAIVAFFVALAASSTIIGNNF